MNIFEKLQELKDLSYRKWTIEEELQQFFLTEFIKKPYKVELFEVEEKWEENIKVYYPVLEVPKGYVKEVKKIVKHDKNLIISYEYVLRDSKGKEVNISENVRFKKALHEGSIQTNFAMITGKVRYFVDVMDEKYQFERSFDFMELLDQALKDKLLRKFTYESEGYYQKTEEFFKKYMNSFGKKDEIPSLKEITKAGRVKIQISENLLADIVVIRKVYVPRRVVLSNSQITVYLDSKPGYFVELICYLKTADESIKLNEKTFAFNILENEQEYTLPVSLYEVLST